MQAFTESPECLAADGKSNITLWFDYAFMGGFGLHLANFIFHAFVDPHMRNVKKQFYLMEMPKM